MEIFRIYFYQKNILKNGDKPLPKIILHFNDSVLTDLTVSIQCSLVICITIVLKLKCFCSGLSYLIVDYPDSKVHGANMGPTLVLLAPDVPKLVPWTLLSVYIWSCCMLIFLYYRLSFNFIYIVLHISYQPTFYFFFLQDPCTRGKKLFQVSDTSHYLLVMKESGLLVKNGLNQYHMLLIVSCINAWLHSVNKLLFQQMLILMG